MVLLKNQGNLLPLQGFRRVLIAGNFARARADLERAYRAAGAAAALECHVAAETGHRETPAMRAGVLDFLRRRLAPAHAGGVNARR